MAHLPTSPSLMIVVEHGLLEETTTFTALLRERIPPEFPTWVYYVDLQVRDRSLCDSSYSSVCREQLERQNSTLSPRVPPSSEPARRFALLRLIWLLPFLHLLESLLSRSFSTPLMVLRFSSTNSRKRVSNTPSPTSTSPRMTAVSNRASSTSSLAFRLISS